MIKPISFSGKLQTKISSTLSGKTYTVESDTNIKYDNNKLEELLLLQPDDILDGARGKHGSFGYVDLDIRTKNGTKKIFVSDEACDCIATYAEKPVGNLVKSKYWLLSTLIEGKTFPNDLQELICKTQTHLIEIAKKANIKRGII